MMRYAGWMLSALLFLATAAHAADLTGTWQGTVQQGTAQTQYVLKIFRAPKRGYRGSWYILGQERPGSPKSGDSASAIARDGQNIKFTLDQTFDNFTGTLSPDGKSMSGNWLCCWGPQKPQALTLTRASAKDAWVVDPSAHKISFITVQPGVKLEVLDWGGSGTPLLFLAGLGNTAHAFDDFAPKFTAHHHVYAITRRGFGASSVPATVIDNYDADRLGDDVLAVSDALKLEKPFIAGHSISGLELTSIGTRHPEKISGLIYLDAISSSRAYYAPDTDTFEVDIDNLRRILNHYPPAGDVMSDFRARIEEMQALMPRMEKGLASLHDQLKDVPDSAPIPNSPQQQASRAILSGERKYGAGAAPILVIASSPPGCGSACDSAPARAYAAQVASYIDAFQAGNPRARMVRLPHASHQVWRSNEAQVEQEMNAFMDGLH